MEKSAALVLDKDYSNGLLWAGLESSWITPSKIGKLILKKYGRGPFNRMLNVKRAAQFKQRSLELATIYDEVSLIGPRDPRLFNWRKLKAEGVVHAVGTFDDVPKDVIIPTDYLASRLWISRNSITRAINSTLHLANIKFTMKVFEVWRLCEVFLLLKEHLGADSGHDLWRILTVVAPKNTPLGYKFIRDKDYSSIFLRSIGRLVQELGIRPFIIGLSLAEIVRTSCSLTMLDSLSSFLQIPYVTSLIDKPVYEYQNIFEPEDISEVYEICCFQMERELKYSPRVETVDDMLKLREDKRIIAFRKAIIQWASMLNEGNKNIQREIKKELIARNADLQKLNKWRKVDKWLFFTSVPVGLLPVISTLHSLISFGLRIHIENKEKENWLALGR